MTVNKKYNSLLKSGFTYNEAKIYLALLELGECSAFLIAQKTQIPRTTVYSTLDQLKQRNLVSTWKKNGVNYFEASHPKTIISELSEQIDSVKKVLPDLVELMSEANSTKPSIKFFAGKKSIKLALDHLYDQAEKRKCKKFYTLSHPELVEYFPKYLTSLLHRKNKLGIHTCLIVPKVRKNYPWQYQNDALREVRFLDEKYSFNCSMIISDAEVVLLSLVDARMHAVIISSQTICNMFKQIFMFTWQMLK